MIESTIREYDVKSSDFGYLLRYAVALGPKEATIASVSSVDGARIALA